MFGRTSDTKMVASRGEMNRASRLEPNGGILFCLREPHRNRKLGSMRRQRREEERRYRGTVSVVLSELDALN